MKCKHKFRTLREGRVHHASANEDTIIQCDKCLEVFYIDIATNKIGKCLIGLEGEQDE